MEPLIALLLIGVLCVAGVVGAALAIRRNHQRANEVVPGVATAAPEAWAGAHTREARLHRRLRDAVSAVRGLPPSLGVDAAVADAIGQEALTLDEQLVGVARLPEGAGRDDALDRVEATVESLERAVAGLLTGSDTGQPGGAVSRHVDDARAHRRALLEARQEVEALDQTTPDPRPVAPEPRRAAEPHATPPDAVVEDPPEPRQEPGT